MTAGFQEAIDSIIFARSSTRAFTDQPVSDADVEDILRVASRAPSGTNAQPWRAYVLRGASKAELVRKVCAAHDAVFTGSARPAEYEEEYDYYPKKWFSPYLDRRRQNGYSLYELVGIPKDDKTRMHAQHQKNFRFFDAPVGIMFTLHRELGRGSILDYGMFLQNVMLAAKARRIDSCPQAAWNRFSKIILPHIGAAPEEMLVCGIALGYADNDAAVNRLQTPRAEPREFTTFLG